MARDQEVLLSWLKRQSACVEVLWSRRAHGRAPRALSLQDRSGFLNALDSPRWDVMAVSGIKPNRITYNILISSSAKARTDERE